MKRLCWLLPLTNLIFFTAVAIAFAAQHGGWRGNVPVEHGIPDTVTGDDGLVLYNRWSLIADREPLFTKAFIIANAPSFGVAKLLIGVLTLFIGEFQSAYPFGLSYPSYTVTLGLLLSSMQWFGIGLALDLGLEWMRRGT